MEKRIQRVRHEIKMREVEVASVRQLAPNYLSVTFKGETLHDFISPSYDDHVKFMPDEQTRRDFTPRSYDNAARELTVEFALHSVGEVSDWARQAAVGQRVVIAGPRGSMIIPSDYAWQVLAGDATAFPAIRRRLEELPAGVKVQVLVTGDDAGTIEFKGEAQVDVSVLAGPEQLVDAVRAMQLPEGDGFFWCAGEAAMASQVRDILFNEKGHPREAARISAYWKKGASAHHENLE